MSHADDVRSVPPSPPVDTSAALEPPVPARHGPLDAAHRPAELFAHAPAAMLLVTPAGRILAASDRSAALLGLPQDQLTGRRLGHFLTSASQSTLTAFLKAVFSGRDVHSAEVTLLSPAGESSAVVIDARQCGASTSQLILRDVTAMRAGQDGLLGEVEALRAQVRALQRRQRQADEEVQQVIRSAGRQLHVHLGEVQQSLDLHARELPVLTRPRDALADSFVLLGALEQYLQARALRLRPQRVDLDRVFREVHRDLQVADRRVTWSWDALPTVLGDARALRMILREYLVNALKFTRSRKETQLQVQVVDAGGEYWIGVKDNGVGFSRQRRERVFELFTRLHASEQYEGAGLGLAVVRHLCERMGGRAWAEGRVGQGATFWVACPKVPPSRE